MPSPPLLPAPPSPLFNEGLSFTDKHAPRPPDPPSLFVGAVDPPAADKPRPDAFALYLGDDLRRLRQDMEARPEHYSTDQKQTFEKLRRGETATAAARADLLLTFMRRTEAQKAERQVRRDKTAAETVSGEELPAFEDQALFKNAIQW